MEKSPARSCIIDAPCKINLHLEIGEKRPDGYHSLKSIFALLAFGDTLCFECVEKKGDSLRFRGHLSMRIPRGKNLIFRAVSLFREQTGFDSGLKITVDKRIPGGAGLGGGSSDAASSLLALNLLAGEALPMEKLREMAAVLGSDVPFFLTGGGAYVSGRGELVESVKLPEGLWVILVMPPFSSDTSTAFRLLDKAMERGYRTGTRPEPLKKKLSREALLRALYEDPQTWPFYNDFLPVFSGGEAGGSGKEKKCKKTGFYRTILDNLEKLGASFAGLSGSGSCCFGIFNSKLAAETAEKELSRYGYFVRLTFFLAHKADPVLK